MPVFIIFKSTLIFLRKKPVPCLPLVFQSLRMYNNFFSILFTLSGLLCGFLKLMFAEQARYDQLLKTSHAFNILDSRGFVGVTERARYFGRMRRWVCLFSLMLNNSLNYLEQLIVHITINWRGLPSLTRVK